MNNLFRVIFSTLISILSLSLLTSTALSGITNNCKTFQFDSKNSTVKTYVTLTDGNHFVVKLNTNDKISGANSTITKIIFDGQVAMNLPDGTFIDDPELLPDETDIITDITYDKPIETIKDLSNWEPKEYSISFSNASTGNFSGILEKTNDDSAPIYYAWDTGSLFDKISDTILIALVQGANYSDPNYQAMTVFPNPATESITISFNFYPQVDGYPSLVGNTLDYLKIYNLEGKVVFEQANIPSRENKQIDIKSLPSGTYIVETAVNSSNLKWHTMFSISR